MSPLQAYPSHYNNNNQWVIIDESSSIASPNQRNSRPQPPLPIIKVPFPPSVNPEELILKPRKAKSKLPTKPPNAFMIYRMQYVKELHARDYRLPMRSVSASVASAWRDEPEHIVEYYEEIAREASKIYNQKYPKPPVQQRSVVGKPPAQRRRSGLTSLTSTPSFDDLNGHVLNHNDDLRQHHYNYNPIRYYSDHNRTLPNGTAHSFTHGGNNHYHNHNMHSPPAIPSLITEHHYGNSGGILGRSHVRSPKSLSAPYPPTSNIHMQLPHVHSLVHYMTEGVTSPTEWDFSNSNHN